ncbi:reverse transcriptase domain-containing protein [Tanacetum coccineum]
MTLKLANRSVTYPAGIAEDVFVSVGKFTFPANFVVVDYDFDPRVPLILGRPFLRTARALVDVYGEGLILRDGDEKLIFHADSTSKYPHKHGNENHFTPSVALPLLDMDIIDPILERFTDEPALVYSFLPRNDDNDLFDFKSNNEKWKKLLYGNPFNNTHSKNEKDKDLKIESLIDDMDDDFFPLLPTSDLTLPHESSKSFEIATLLSSPFGNEDKVFNPDIFILGGTQIFYDESKDKDLKVSSSTEALLILIEDNFLIVLLIVN